MKKSSFRAQKVKRTFCEARYDQSVGPHICTVNGGGERQRTYIIRIVHFQHPTPCLVYFLVTLPTSTHGQCRVHVHVMTGQIQADESLKYNAPPGKC